MFHIVLDGRASVNYFNGASWEGWKSLEGVFTSSLVATSWGPDSVAVFGLGTTKTLYHRFYSDGSGWSTSWKNLSGEFLSEPAAISWGPAVSKSSKSTVTAPYVERHTLMAHGVTTNG